MTKSFLPMSEAISKAVQPFLACVDTSAPMFIKYMATAFLLKQNINKLLPQEIIKSNYELHS